MLVFLFLLENFTNVNNGMLDKQVDQEIKKL